MALRAAAVSAGWQKERERYRERGRERERDGEFARDKERNRERERPTSGRGSESEYGRESSRRMEVADGGRRTDLSVEGMVEGSEEGGGSPAMVAEKGR